MTSTLVNVRLDENTKKGMSEVCSELGISMSAAFNIFAKTVVRERRVLFGGKHEQGTSRRRAT